MPCSALLEHGADVNASETERGTTALMQAADQGHADVLKELIQHGANVAAVSKPVLRDGRSAALGNANDPRRAVRQQAIAVLCEAKKPDLEQVRIQRVLLMGASQKNLPDGRSVQRHTTQAVWASSPSTAPAATPARAWVEKRWPSRWTRMATWSWMRMAIRFLSDTGRGRRPPPREPDGGALTALVYAARTGSIDAARVLLEGGADVNQTTRYGWSPLLAATQNQNYQMAKFLIEHGANVNLANKGGWTPLYLATDNRNIEGGDYPTRTADMDSLAYITYLLDKGANVNARVTESTETRTVFTNQWLNEDGATAFLRAAQSGDLAAAEAAGRAGCRSEDQYQAGRDAAGSGCRHRLGGRRYPGALHRGDGGGREVSAVARASIPTSRPTPAALRLHGAAHKGATEVVKVLVAAGARMDVRDFGNTDNRGSPELSTRTWLPIDYADGLVRVGVQSAIPHPETARVLRELMLKAGLKAPPEGRTLESLCIVDVCKPGYDPISINN